MAQFFIHIPVLSLIYCLVTEAVVRSKIEELAALEEYQLFNHLASSYSSIQNSIEMISLDRTTQNSTSDKIIISQNLKQLSIDLKLYLDIFRVNIVQQGYSPELVKKLKTMMEDIDGILKECSAIIERPREINTTEITDLAMSMEFINLKMTLWQPCCWFDFMKWITTALNLDNEYAYCKEKTSSHQTLFHITKDLITLELTTFAVVKLFHPQHNNSSEKSINFHVSNYVPMTRRIRSYITTASKLLAQWPNVIYSCDIESYVRDINYLDLEGLIEPIFISTYGLESCEKANAYSNIHGCKKYDEALGVSMMEKELLIPAECDGVKRHVFLPLPFDKPCYGYLSNCTQYETKEVCRSLQPTGKRYLWYKIDGHVFGQENSCPDGRFEDFENWGIRKSAILLRPCHCTCTDNGRKSSATHLLDLEWSFADVEENKIIIGVKFIKINTMISLQIKQGILSAEGRIVPGSEEWMSQFHGRSYEFTEPKSIALDDNTAFDLDDVMADPGSLITGVRFYQLGQRIKLMLWQTKFNWKTGVLLDNYISNGIMHPSLNERQLHFPRNNPTWPQYNYGNVEISTPNKYYIKLTESVRYNDAGGTIMPFFDAQNVETDPGSPLTGIGLYYRGSEKSAGLISLRLFGLNYTDILVDYELKYTHIYGINDLINV